MPDQTPRNILFLMMGGSGTRFGADVPKQFVKVNGKPIFSYVIEKYDATSLIDEAIVVCHESWVDFTEEWISKMPISTPCKVIVGGSSRSESVRNGLNSCGDVHDQDVAIIHDATHPYLDDEVLSLVVEAARTHGGATLGAPQYDTVYKIDPESSMLREVIPRETVVSGASPEAFLLKTLKEVYDHATLAELERRTSAGALALHHGIPMQVVPTSLINLKITYKHDMDVFKKLFYDYYF